MHLSILLSSLPLDFKAALVQAAGLGFTHVDVVALSGRSAQDFDVLAESGLMVVCAALARDLPEGQSLDAPDVALRRLALEQVKLHVADAGRLGATHGYVIPGLDATVEGLARFAEACTLLADYAGQRKIRLCLEHIPGRALPTVEATLRWLEKIGHENFSLLLDVGHCSISNENPAQAIRTAGDRLGYVHFDDNDGVGDLHWPLLQGKLTRELLREIVEALGDIHYDGALSLELNPKNADPMGGLREGKKLLEEMLQGWEVVKK